MQVKILQVNTQRDSVQQQNADLAEKVVLKTLPTPTYLLFFKTRSMTEEGERRPREMREELEVEKKRKVEELEELAKEMEREYENRVKKALAQLRFNLS